MQVLIVGAGPVGMTLGLELARYGVSVRVVDAAAARTDKSKALVVWSRTLELLDRSGSTAAFTAAGTLGRAATVTAGGKRIARIEFTGVESPHPYALMIPQSETERVLEASLAQVGVTVERATELLRFGAGPTGVQAVLRGPSGREESVDAEWMVGCDGAHSTVRHGLGLEFQGSTMPIAWLLADVHLTGLPAGPDTLQMFWHDAGLLALFPIVDGRWRVIADLGPASEGTASPPSLADVQAVLDARGPSGTTASRPLWLTTFGINERMVSSYRAHRVFLAGDAAHVHSPAGGQGMNTGMQDAFNLAWKLAMVIHGAAASDALLDSYSTERCAVARGVLSGAGRLTAASLLHGPAAEVRNVVAHLLMGLSPMRRLAANTLSEVSIGYPHSPLTRGHGGFGGPAPGERAPPREDEPPAGAGSRPRFACFTADTHRLAALAARFPDLVDPLPRRPYAAGATWLVRPDGYVGAAAQDSGWDALAEYLAALQPR